MSKGSEMLRMMADQYASRAEIAKRSGHYAEAASYLRVWEDLLTGAQEAEERQRAGYEEPMHCTDYEAETPLGQQLMDGTDYPGDCEEM